MRRPARGFTLVEVLVALMIVAMGLAALMVAVSGAARTSGYLRDKTLAQWIALNRLTEVRLNTNKFGKNADVGELEFASRRWHYDKRVVVRVYAGDAKTKGNPLAESSTFLGSSLSVPGTTVANWTLNSGQPGAPTAAAAAAVAQPVTPGVSPANATPLTPTTTPSPTTAPTESQ
jgi:type II secretion system protein I